MTHRLDVFTTDVAEALRYAGGLMFDRSHSGWRVASEPSLIDPRAELLLWGQEVGDEFTGLLHPVGHELSTAARAFKAQALRSAGLDIRVEAYEQLVGGRARG